MRCAATPGSRAIASAIDWSGSLPMSSAETDSIIWSLRFLLPTALCNAARKPVTTIASPSGAGSWVGSAVVSSTGAAASSSVGCVVCASAGVAPAKLIASASGLAAAARRQREDVILIDVDPLIHGLAAATTSCRARTPSPDVEEYQRFRQAELVQRLYIRIQPA